MGVLSASTARVASDGHHYSHHHHRRCLVLSRARDMALKIEYRGTTTGTIKETLQMCFTCKIRKEGLFTIDMYGNPMCAECAEKARRPMP